MVEVIRSRDFPGGREEWVRLEERPVPLELDGLLGHEVERGLGEEGVQRGGPGDGQGGEEGGARGDDGVPRGEGGGGG